MRLLRLSPSTRFPPQIQQPDLTMTMRRSHKKSRNGCKECKRRHIERDERRPSCSHCVTAERQCSYLLLYSRDTPPHPSRSAGSPLVPFVDTPAPTPPVPESEAENLNSPGASPGISPESGLLGEGYSLLHMELFHHFDHNYASSFPQGPPELEPFLQLALREAFACPYLMDELLAVAAAHKSTCTQDPARQDLYRTEATRLQTRAVARLSAASSQCNISDENYIPLFLSSIFLGQHTLFDVFSPPPADLASVLDRFTHCLGLQRGIRAIAWRTLPRVSARLGSDPGLLELGPEYLGGPSSPDGPRGTECASLADLLRNKSQLATASRQACCGAVELLQDMFDSARQTEGTARRFIVVQEWPARVSVAYVELLAERRPEALVVLAYYGVLMHRAREYWPLGGAGRYLVRSITAHLGSYWAEWLEWPNSVLDASEPGS